MFFITEKWTSHWHLWRCLQKEIDSLTFSNSALMQTIPFRLCSTVDGYVFNEIYTKKVYTSVFWWSQKLQSSCIFNKFSVEDYNELTMMVFYVLSKFNYVFVWGVRWVDVPILPLLTFHWKHQIYYVLIGNSILTSALLVTM